MNLKNLLTVLFAFVFMLSSAFAKDAPKPSQRKVANSPGDKSAECYSAAPLEAARGIVEMELKSSLSASYKNFVGRVKNACGGRFLGVEEDPKKWTSSLLGSDEEHDVGHNFSSVGCAYVFFISASCSFHHGLEVGSVSNGAYGTPMNYMVMSEVVQGEDGRWVANSDTPQRVQFRVYKNNNPRGALKKGSSVAMK